MEPPKEIVELVERFEEHEEVYKNKDYKEAQLRVDFLNPFFNALGWDVYNTKSYDPEYREVVTEDRLVIGGETKAPDYSFRITSRERKFFVEAKQPYVNIFADSKSAFQLRRYAYTASLPLSILTTFDRFAIYDCRPEPNKDDRATDACIKQLTYKDYLKEWEFIYKTFARESIFKGSFDKYAREAKTKTVIKPFDQVFLSDIESWRRLLAEDIAQNNKDITEQELNKAVQLTIDRILFMRICETRGYEKFGGLQGLMNGENIYGRLIDRFKEADKKYNSGLFHFHKEENREHFDGLSLTLNIGDGIFKQIFKRLYYPDCPYEYSVIEADILGSIYERFLGNVIYLSKDHQAKVDQKPEVRKAGGVYYTPSYIVKYIVENTVGKLAEGKTPEEVSKLRICDPACGSGSFLLEAFHFLLEWHHKYYLANKPAEIFKKKGSPLVMTAEGNYKLSLAERKRILSNNIYGVDIDAQAVEVTKLSLLLKVIESLLPADLLDKRILPDLGTNIKCGNSLIGTDFFDGKEKIKSEEWNKVRPFDWEKEFPEIFKNGGFDTVIGNPPYGILFELEIKEYLENKYETFKRNNEKYVAFVDKSISLMNNNAFFSFIIPNTYIKGPYFIDLRNKISLDVHISKIIDFGIIQIFDKPNVFCSILIFTKDKSKENTKYKKIINVDDLLSENDFKSISKEDIINLKWVPLNNIVEKLSKNTLFSEILEIKDVGLNYWTIGRGKTRGGSIADRVFYNDICRDNRDIAFIKGRDINKYKISFSNNYLIHDYENKLDKDIDILRFSSDLLLRKKIVYRQTSDHLEGTYDNHGYITDKTVHSILLKNNKYSLLYVLGLFNSKLLNYLYKSMSDEDERAFAQVKIFRIKLLPFKEIDFNNKKDVERHDVMVRLVEQMLELNKRLQQAKTPDDKELLSRQIEATDRQIDGLVYELYELTPDEIAIVEESTK